MAQTCSWCAHCAIQKAEPLSGQRDSKVCRRYPPQVTTLILPSPSGPVMGSNTAWPVVNDADFCGEFKPKLVPATPH